MPLEPAKRAPFRLLIDTCVWLDVAKDPKLHPLIGVIEELLRHRAMEVLVPSLVREEFQRNRERVEKESAKILTTHFRLVKEAITKAGGDPRRQRAVLSHLDDVNHKIPLVGGAAASALGRIEKLLMSGIAVEPTTPARLRAVERAVGKKAPFHRGKNSMADAILIETFAECVNDKKAAGVRFALVTHNKHDFSVENGNQKQPHAHFAGVFSRIKSLYFVNLAEALRRIDPSMVTDIMLEHSWSQDPRGLSEILEAEDLLFHQVWYNRHWNLRIGVQEGRIKVVEQETYPRAPGAPETVQRDVWKRALASARRVERRYGKKNLGPWDDFEWGMINGKLSALRWLLGDEWDMLDT
jgi:hypothetical protein